jgi:hypothetical protein
MKTKIPYTIELEPSMHEFLQQMVSRYNLPDVGKAVRCLINHAREQPAQLDAVFSQIHCTDC